jgi:hypothetical protein
MARRVSPYRTAASHVRVVSVLMVGVFLGIIFLMVRPRGKGNHHEAVWQMAQLNAMSAAIELFNHEFDTYPPSDANDPLGRPYCGAMKLAEALVGQDLLGMHSKSVFRRDGVDAAGDVSLYPGNIDALDSAVRHENLRTRKGPYLLPENARAFRLVDVYGKGNTGPFPEDTLVLCDSYEQTRPSGKRTGMPILYYRANPSGTAHKPGDPNNIYHSQDNQMLLALGVPGQLDKVHPLSDPTRFYLNTQSVQITTAQKSHRPDTFILISAGADGLYGTPDDICNFRWRYRER